MDADQSLDMDHSFAPEMEAREFFWSMEIKPGKRYSETLNEDLHITHICLGDDAKANSLSILYCEPEENLVHPICRLREGKTDQLMLNLYFPAGADLTLFSKEDSATLHLLGYFQEVNDFDSEDEEDSDIEDSEDEEEEDEEVKIDPKSSKRKAEAPPTQQQPTKKAKDAKKSIATASAPNLGQVNLKEATKKKEVAKKEVKKDAKKEAPKKEEPAKKEAPKKEAPKKDEIGMSKKLAQGVVATVTQAGKGTAVAKNGKKVKVQYRGTLQKGGKQFDAGKIDFRLGIGEVIKGWDIGVNGMKLGEKRTLIIPPAAGYGKRGAPPDIPPHATLKFEVTLLNIQ
uniref:peptidylprolyl isomerase n=1 Tax=Paramoeba aestuarina TaxID=180227 RepID=A0A7S4KFM9_9EUKA